MNNYRIVRPRVGALIAALATISIATAVSAAETAQIEIKSFAFQPQEITVAPGTTVVWINRDESPHNVRESAKIFRSKVLDTGDSFSFVFEKPGDYAYHCTLHPQMIGTVHVAASGK